MNCVDYEFELDDYIEGRLDADARVGIERHLLTCAACRALAADLRTLQEALQLLEPQLPSPQVWHRVADAIEAETRRQRTTRWFGLGPVGWRAALPAACTVALLLGGVWLAFQDVSSSTPPPLRSADVATPSRPPQPPSGTMADTPEAHYARTITSLEQITQRQGNALDAPTAEVMQANLAVLDNAIGESREALQSDPFNDVAQDSLLEALRTKVALLQDTIVLINDLRRGTDDGSARIISGTNQ